MIERSDKAVLVDIARELENDRRRLDKLFGVLQKRVEEDDGDVVRSGEVFAAMRHHLDHLVKVVRSLRVEAE